MRSQSRTGFTLIELMVAMALTMFLMVILTQCFVLSLETFAGMKGIGDMQQNLRTATVMLQSDLSADHFEGDRRLSDPSISNGTAPIQAGFFLVQQGSAVTAGLPAVGPLPASFYYQEGLDANAVASCLANNHVLYFTVKRKGNRPESFFTAALKGMGPELVTFFNNQTAYNMLPIPNPAVATPDLPNSTYTTPYGGGPTAFYSSQWAEVFYYLMRTGSTEEPNNPASVIGTPTFSLYRAQFVMVPDSTNLGPPPPPVVQGVITNGFFNTFAALACNQGAAHLVFYSPMNAAAGTTNRTLGSLAGFTNITPPAATAVDVRAEQASTLVLANVLSFQVQVMDTNANTTAFGDVSLLAPAWNRNTTYALGDLANRGGISYRSLTAGNRNHQPPNVARWVVQGYDTANTNNFSLKGIKVTMRVWDNATRQTRQASVIQDF